MKKTLYFLVIAFSLLLLANNAKAEPYLSVYAGLAIPHDANITNNVTHETGQMNFYTKYTIGAKAGYWFAGQGAPYLGFQLDGNAYHSKIREITASSGTVASVTANADFRSVTANVIIRSPEGNIKPYIGAGAGWFYADIGPGNMPTPAVGINGGGWKGGTDSAPGFQALAGLDFTITKYLSFFGEYRYSTAKFSLDSATGVPLDITYKVSQLYGGLTYGF